MTDPSYTWKNSSGGTDTLYMGQDSQGKYPTAERTIYLPDRNNSTTVLASQDNVKSTVESYLGSYALLGSKTSFTFNTTTTTVSLNNDFSKYPIIAIALKSSASGWYIQSVSTAIFYNRASSTAPLVLQNSDFMCWLSKNTGATTSYSFNFRMVLSGTVTSSSTYDLYIYGCMH